MRRNLYTIGHSTRSFEALCDLLAAHGVRQLADVRSFPASRRHPHFARGNLEAALPECGIVYQWMRELGGLRQPSPGSSINAAWRVAGFRAYADYMATPEFRAACAALEEWAARATTACMCAEAFYLKCHRQLLADALVARGWQVLHIESLEAPRPHTLTPFARVGGDGNVTYPSDPELPLGPRIT